MYNISVLAFLKDVNTERALRLFVNDLIRLSMPSGKKVCVSFISIMLHGIQG